MTEFLVLFVRILLRYAAGALAARGVIDGEMQNILTTDPDILQAVNILAAGIAAAVAEVWFWLAKRKGWTH